MCDTYRKTVSRLFSEQSDQIIDNGRSEHAAVLFENFFKHAESTVRILCQNLSPAVFDTDEVIDAARGAIERGVLVKVCAQKQIESGSRFFREFGSKVEHCKCSSDFTDGPNFSTMDHKGFRFESDPSKHVASASANNPKLATQLAGIFEKQVCFAN